MRLAALVVPGSSMSTLVHSYLPKKNIKLPGLLIHYYILKEYLLSFMVAFLFFLALFFVNQILVFARNQLAEMTSIFDTLKLILYVMPAIIALSVPYASLVGVILAVGKFSEGREILALRASGQGFSLLLTPILIAALLLSGISFIVNDYFLPLGTMNYNRLYQELLYSNSRLIIEPYAIRKYENSILITGAVNDHSIEGIIILETTTNGTERTISASRAELLRNDHQQGIITLALDNVEIISRTDSTIQESYAEFMNYNILLENIVPNISNPSVREMSTRDVYTLIQQQAVESTNQYNNVRSQYDVQNARFQANMFAYAENGNNDIRSQILATYSQLPADPDEYFFDRSLRLYRLEFWKKFSIPLASFTFILLGFPLGLMALRTGKTLGIILGLILASVYWSLLTANEAFGMELYTVPAMLIAFSPNIVMLLAGFLLLRFYFRK